MFYKDHSNNRTQKFIDSCNDKYKNIINFMGNRQANFIRNNLRRQIRMLKIIDGLTW